MYTIIHISCLQKVKDLLDLLGIHPDVVKQKKNLRLLLDPHQRQRQWQWQREEETI